MNRWKSPQSAAKRANHTAKEVGKLRNERRKSWLMVIAVVLGSIVLMVADYFWIRSQARQRRERHQKQHQKATNHPALQTNALNRWSGQQQR